MSATRTTDPGRVRSSARSRLGGRGGVEAEGWTFAEGPTDTLERQGVVRQRRRQLCGTVHRAHASSWVDVPPYLSCADTLDCLKAKQWLSHQIAPRFEMDRRLIEALRLGPCPPPPTFLPLVTELPRAANTTRNMPDFIDKLKDSISRSRSRNRDPLEGAFHATSWRAPTRPEGVGRWLETRQPPTRLWSGSWAIGARWSGSSCLGRRSWPSAGGRALRGLIEGRSHQHGAVQLDRAMSSSLELLAVVERVIPSRTSNQLMFLCIPVLRPCSIYVHVNNTTRHLQPEPYRDLSEGATPKHHSHLNPEFADVPEESEHGGRGRSFVPSGRGESTRHVTLVGRLCIVGAGGGPRRRWRVPKAEGTPSLAFVLSLLLSERGVRRRVALERSKGVQGRTQSIWRGKCAPHVCERTSHPCARARAFLRASDRIS